MPPVSGVLTTVMYLMPWLGKWVRPMLERKGARVKRDLKARKAAEATREAS